MNKKSVKQYDYAMTQFRETVEEVLYDQKNSRSPKSNNLKKPTVTREANRSSLSLAPPERTQKHLSQ